MKALIVDSSKTYRALLKEFLYGYSIIPEEVTSGAEALKACESNDFGLVCVSMQLSDMLGVELAHQLKSRQSNAFIIILSSETEQGKLDKMHTADINAVCQKMDITELKKTLAHISEGELVVCESSGHVLYVEDHLTLANMTMEILAQMGLTVEHFTSADESIEAFANNHYDLVLLDIILPGDRDGIDVIQAIRARSDEKKSIPILAISSISNSYERIRALKVGANDFITKPVLQAELAVRVKNLIDTRHLYQQVILQKKELEKIAMTDQLTGLFNRYYLHLAIRKSLSQVKRHAHPLSLIMIDLDKFKYINDNFGHEQGDDVLLKVAGVLQKNCRLEDTAVRLGGDEFLLVLPNCSKQEAIQKAEMIRALIKQLNVNHDEVNISGSFGVSSTEQDVFDYKALFNLADKAAYQAKSSGGNAVRPKP
ncbi:diguanylate cyclase [Colwellia sp. D2M02]|uniref:GGDEF domain-containing response regulator n=1 Tax=Colwellia sp. D2M02 TaxID=2841562 RepID=UPI001C09F871|nr:diguanylate cyclase [Colwellia sp. D2M02]MBU2894650.1 diguanylate cyclase [Colwellia sp. D2M02]